MCSVPAETRSNDPVITSARLAEIWPAASERLLRVLAARGLDRTRGEDLVQEAGIRALQANVAFDTLDEFLWWAVPVVRNMHIDLLRTSRWSISSAELPDRECPAPAVDRVVESRMALRTVLTRLADLPAGERDVIVAAATDAPVEGARKGTAAVRRHRARAHLRRIVGGALGAAGVGLGRLGRKLRGPALSGVPVGVAAWLTLPALVLGMNVHPAGPASGAPETRLVLQTAVSVREPAERPVRAPRRVPAAPIAAPVRAGNGGGGAGTVAAPVPPLQSTTLEVRPGGGPGVRAERRDARQGDKLVCVYNLPAAGTRCVDPVRGVTGP